VLAKSPPDIEKLREIVADIRKADERGGEIIGYLRGFLRHDERSLSEVSIRRAIVDVLHIVEWEAVNRIVGSALPSAAVKIKTLG
jgi:C4-dicarboxylate-specific signal transduction histidine kinase